MSSNAVFWSRALVLPLVMSLTSAASCPTSILTVELSSPPVVTNPTCPGDNGSIVKGPDGHYFSLVCCSHGNSGAVHISDDNGSSLDECMSKSLAVDPECNSFRYIRSTNTCMFYKQGAFDPAPTCSVPDHDWYYITDPPTQQSTPDQTILCSTECPFANGQNYVSEVGGVYHMDCGKRHGTIEFKHDTQASFRDCIDSCAAIPKCSNVDFSNRTSTCYYGTHSGAPLIDAPGYFSAYSIGCAGACDKDDKDCCCSGSCSKGSVIHSGL